MFTTDNQNSVTVDRGNTSFVSLSSSYYSYPMSSLDIVVVILATAWWCSSIFFPLYKYFDNRSLSSKLRWKLELSKSYFYSTSVTAFPTPPPSVSFPISFAFPKFVRKGSYNLISFVDLLAVRLRQFLTSRLNETIPSGCDRYIFQKYSPFSIWLLATTWCLVTFFFSGLCRRVLC